MMRRTPARQGERGFALLIVFLLAAAVALTIYQQLPRVAFESAREKEQLLMDRGNQYRRAIEVYYAVNKRYPAKLEDLENTNDKRFLRHRYIDPLTGKDEWRLIHSNGSALTDSLVEKPPTQNAQNSNLPGGGPLGANNMNTSQAGLAALAQAGSNNNPNDPNAQAQPALNPAARQRPSDRIVGQQGAQPGGGQSMFPGSFYSPSNGAQYDPNDPRTWPPITLAAPNTPGQNNQQPNQQPGQGNQFNGSPQFNPSFQQPVQLTTSPSLGSSTNPTGFAGTLPFPGGVPGQSSGLGGANPQQLGLAGGNFGGNQTLSQAGISQNSQPPGFDPNQYPQNINQNNTPSYNNTNIAGNNAGPPPNAVPSPFPTGGANPALALIGNQLSQGTPAPTPAAAGTTQGNNLFPANNAAGNNLAGNANNPTGTTGGPGIAGVASRFEGPSIKSYKERLKYQEWEFVYKPEDSKGQVAQQPAQQGLGPAGQGPTNQNSMGIGSAFGPSTNGTAGPGQNGTGQGQMGNPLGLFGNSPSTPSPQSNPPGVP